MPSSSSDLNVLMDFQFREEENIAVEDVALH